MKYCDNKPDKQTKLLSVSVGPFIDVDNDDDDEVVALNTFLTASITAWLVYYLTGLVSTKQENLLFNFYLANLMIPNLEPVL